MNRDQIEATIPHAGPMCLLDYAEHWDEDGIRCRSATHRDAANPLRRNGRLRSVNLVEYAAQAAALHDALMTAGDDRGPGGMLVEVRDVAFHCGEVGSVETEVTIEAVAQLRGAGGLIYRFTVSAAEATLVTGRLTIATD